MEYNVVSVIVLVTTAVCIVRFYLLMLVEQQ